LDPAALIARGESFLALGDISAARLLYERAAESGSARAMTALGKTYDPGFLDRAKVIGIRPDPALAAEWYRKAAAFDDGEAALRLKALAQR
jgi:TPR repeat protein